MKEKLRRFMMGRYGVDAYGKCTLILGLVLYLLDGFIKARVLHYIAIFLVIYTYYRMFSKNIGKRAAENQEYLKKTTKVRSWFYTQKNMFEQRKTHHIYKCPSCKQKIRVPRGKGKIEIRCPKCNTTFVKKS